MVAHSMNAVNRTISFLNNDRAPVITFDEPLYVIGKKNSLELSSNSLLGKISVDARWFTQRNSSAEINSGLGGR